MLVQVLFSFCRSQTASASAPGLFARSCRALRTTTVRDLHCQAAQLTNANSENQQVPLKREYNSLNNETPYNLCFLRHGQSTWNRDNRFIGWTDTVSVLMLRELREGVIVMRVTCLVLLLASSLEQVIPSHQPHPFCFQFKPLTDDGVLEARVAGQMLQKSGILFDEVHTSLLRRSIRTANLVLMEMGQEYIPVYKNWRLNERSYGDLVGKNKKQLVEIHGKEQVKRWRRSYDEPPPEMTDDHQYHPARDPRYRLVCS